MVVPVRTICMLLTDLSFFVLEFLITYNFIHFMSLSHQRCWWSSTGVWVTASFRRYPGLFLEFWTITTMVEYRRSWFVLQFPSFWWPFKGRQLQLVSPTSSCSTAVLTLRRCPSTRLSFRFLWFSHCHPQGQQSLIFGRFSFLLTVTRSGRLAEIRWSVCISKCHRIFCVSFSRVSSELDVYNLFVWSNLSFLLDFKWITFPT